MERVGAGDLTLARSSFALGVSKVRIVYSDRERLRVDTKNQPWSTRLGSDG